MCAVFAAERAGKDYVIFTFDRSNLICRIHREDLFNDCSFKNCSSCRSYMYKPDTFQISTTSVLQISTSVTTVTCTGQHGVMYPHPDDCTKYIECVHSLVYTRDCPGGLHFNDNLNVCDYPAAAGCQ
ncbi:endochitinase-like [Saccostrea echinata]|uniref:endochitinase-like n=1 Tax=Saccostrea echinata TaxID=191078 RepID=UPI002A83BEF5|nr:endochitinase-like [Saccostrea echinata]